MATQNPFLLQTFILASIFCLLEKKLVSSFQMEYTLSILTKKDRWKLFVTWHVMVVGGRYWLQATQTRGQLITWGRGIKISRRWMGISQFYTKGIISKTVWMSKESGLSIASKQTRGVRFSSRCKIRSNWIKELFTKKLCHGDFFVLEVKLNQVPSRTIAHKAEHQKEGIKLFSQRESKTY